VAALPFAALAQQAMPVIGFLGSDSPELYADRLIALHRGLQEVGYVEGQNVALEYRSARQDARTEHTATPAWSRRRGDRIRRSEVCDGARRACLYAPPSGHDACLF
jgi:putative tryptophan/tyrosine transport system substrate-binding protein